ncbi:hypothetical protein R3P38DRAFT_1255114 [Favolaschia claudopus]|uniref:Uncharacterized protein n=1 Tax=Favolaschia claudopus TaxID=2862362 RepID=A0AAW0B1T0_9AGAR
MLLNEPATTVIPTASYFSAMPRVNSFCLSPRLPSSSAIPPGMAEVAGFLGAAATAGAASLAAASGFTARHENSLREAVQATRKSTADFLTNLHSGIVTDEAEIAFRETRADAVQTAEHYYEALDCYKNASWIKNPIDKLHKKTEVRKQKRLARQYNQHLESLNESMHSDSDSSSTIASAGSPPGSNASAEGIGEWRDEVAANADAHSDGNDLYSTGLPVLVDWEMPYLVPQHTTTLTDADDDRNAPSSILQPPCASILPPASDSDTLGGKADQDPAGPTSAKSADTIMPRTNLGTRQKTVGVGPRYLGQSL